MKVSKLSIKFYPNINITDKIPIYAKKTLEQEILLIKYHFKCLFENIKVNENNINSDILKNTGIFKIGRNPKEGIGFIGEQSNYIITIPHNDILNFTSLNKITGDAESIITIDKEIFSKRSKIKNDISVEEEFDDIISMCESRLITLKQKLQSFSQPYIPSGNERNTLSKINQIMKTKRKITKISDAAKLNNSEMQTIKSISGKYAEIKEIFKKFNNPTTASNVRTYYKNYITSKSNRAAFSFKDIGPANEDITISLIIHRGKSYTVLKVSGQNNPPFALVISPDGEVQKNLPYIEKTTISTRKRKDSVPDYYETAELDKLNISKYLDCIEKELELFRNHAANWHKKQIDFIAEHTNINIGSTKKFTNKINKIFNSVEKLKENIKKHYQYLNYCQTFMKENNINIEFSRRGLRFEEITPEKYDIRVTFPTILNERVTQRVILDGEEIKDSFFIIGEKLLKLDIKKYTNAFSHPTRQRYYHSQEYVDNSRLGEYIDLMEKYLNRANRVITNKSTQA